MTLLWRTWVPQESYFFLVCFHVLTGSLKWLNWIKARISVLSAFVASLWSLCSKNQRWLELSSVWALIFKKLFLSPGCFYIIKKESWLSFPGCAVVENLPANAGDTGSSPGLGRSHMPRSNWAREPQLLSLRGWSLCPAAREAAIVRGPRTAMKNGPRLPQLEKALAQKRRPNTAKDK